MFWWYFADLKQYLPTDFAENLLARAKNQIKAWCRILGTEILSYEEFHLKTTQISEENKFHPGNKNSQDSLASNLSYVSIWVVCVHSFETMPQVLF